MDNMKKTQEVLMNSIFEVFEKMFFVFLEPLDEEIRYDMVATIQFNGPEKGEIKAYLSKGIAGTMVQNMLGLDLDEVTEKTMEDCAKEALNMIAGSFLNKWDPKKVFDLTIPSYELKTGLFSKDPATTLSLAFDSEDSQMAVTMKLESKA